MSSVHRRLAQQPYLVQQLYPNGDAGHFAMLADLSAIGWPPMSSDLEALLQMHCPCRRCGAAVDVFADHVRCASGEEWFGDRVVLNVPAAFVADVERETDPVRRQRRREHLNAKSRAQYRQRKQQIEAGGIRHTEDEIRALYEFQGGHCFYCYQPLRIDNYEWDVARDHFVPLARGGHDGISNIVLTCGLCNNRKLAKDGHWFLRSSKRAASKEVKRLLTLLHPAPSNCVPGDMGPFSPRSAAVSAEADSLRGVEFASAKASNGSALLLAAGVDGQVCCALRSARARIVAARGFADLP